MSWKLYDHLGLSKGASKEEIKKAYKKKALETHPDRGGDPEIFKQVNNAYSILNDDDTKGRYDQLGDDGFEASGGAGGGGAGGMNIDPNEIFRQFFGGGGMGGFNFHFNGHPHGGGNTQQTTKKADHRHVYKISLNDAYSGAKRGIRIMLHKTCISCSSTCYDCQGQGQITEMHRMGFFTQMMTRTCGQCNGSGSVAKPKSNCKECKGEGKYTKENIVHLDIPSGVETGHIIVFEEMGEQPTKTGEKPGDLHIEIFVQPHEQLTRQGNDLHIRLPISFRHSIIGTKIKIPYFTGDFEIDTSDLGILQSAKHYIIKDRGMPIRGKKENEHGNMIVQFDIQYPSTKISPEHAKQIENILTEAGI